MKSYLERRVYKLRPATCQVCKKKQPREIHPIDEPYENGTWIWSWRCAGCGTREFRSNCDPEPSLLVNA